MSYGLVLQTFSTDKTNTAATTTGKKTETYFHCIELDLDICALQISALHFSSCNSVENENETAKKKNKLPNNRLVPAATIKVFKY